MRQSLLYVGHDINPTCAWNDTLKKTLFIILLIINDMQIPGKIFLCSQTSNALIIKR